MKQFSPEQIRSFLTKHIEHWNAGNREAFTALYREAAPDGLVIEYVGQPIGDGWQAFNYMWDHYNGQMAVKIIEILVNGIEGACYYHNVSKADGVAHPSIEIYRFDAGKLHIRYFHRTESL